MFFPGTSLTDPVDRPLAVEPAMRTQVIVVVEVTGPRLQRNPGSARMRCAVLKYGRRYAQRRSMILMKASALPLV